MIIFLLLLLVAVSVVTELILTRKWLIQRAGVDIEQEAIEIKQVERLTTRQMLILGLLALPTAIFVLWVVVYVVAGVVVTVVGIPATTG